MRIARIAIVMLLSVLVLAEGALQVAALFARDRSTDWRDGARQRILCIGDSHTYGAGVDPTQSYPGHLQRLLDEAEPGQYAVLNLGVPGMNTSQLRHRVRDWLAEHQPDVLIVWAGVNNAWNNAEVDDVAESVLDRLDRFLLRSRLYKLVQIQINDREIEHQVEHERDTAGDASRVKPRAVADFRAIADLARAANVKLVFVTYPVSLGWFDEANQAMWEVSRAYDVFIVDSSRSLDRVPVERREWLWAMHPGGETYAEIARDVSAVVLDHDRRVGRARDLDDARPTAADREIMLRAFKTLTLESGSMTADERARLDKIQRLSGTAFDLDTLPPVSPAELAAGLGSPIQRRRVIDALVEIAGDDGMSQPQEQHLIDAYAQALGVERHPARRGRDRRQERDR
jgi:lysophospholipase L1-like esterase/tellurite resistance protein